MRSVALRSVALVALLTALLQTAGATWLVSDYASPNFADGIARELVTRGDYAVDVWYPILEGPPPAKSWRLRAFQLPAEPLYLAAGFRFLPAGAHPYLHVPVTTALVTAIAFVAFLVGGRRCALAAGLVANAYPFIVKHGAVWDDAFLGAALLWTVVGLVMAEYWQRTSSIPVWVRHVFVAALAAGAALARLEEQWLLAILALLPFAVRSLRPFRPGAVAAGAGLVAGLGMWTIRNWIVLGAVLIGTTHDGQAWWQSNHAQAREAILGDGVTMSRLLTRVPPNLDELQINAYMRAKGFDYLRSQPIDAAKTAALKIAVSLSGLDLGQPITTARNVIAGLSNLVLLVMALIGIRRHSRQAWTWPASRLLLIWGIAMALLTISLLATGPVGARYRITATGLLFIAAGAALTKRLDPAEPNARLARRT